MRTLNQVLLLIVMAAPPAIALGAEIPRTAEQTAGPYVPTPQVVVDRMLDLAKVGPGDLVVDLGSGDGRLVITAAKRFGSKGFGVDIDAGLVQLSNEAAAREGVAELVRFHRADLFETSLAEASVVTIYLLPEIVTRLVPKLLEELRPGARVVSHDYPLLPWTPVYTLTFQVPEKIPVNGSPDTVLYLYLVPARLAGSWDASFPHEVSDKPVRLVFKQTPQRARGAASIDGTHLPLQDLEIIGTRISFTLPTRDGRRLLVQGNSDGPLLRGTIAGPEGEKPWEATLLR